MSSIVLTEKTSHSMLRIANGVFIREGVRDLSAKIKDLKEQGKARFIVDFTDCEYISSEGLGAMSDLWKYCSSQPKGKMAVVFSPDPENDVRYLFHTIGLGTIMKGSVFVDIDEAEKALGCIAGNPRQ